MGVWVGVTLASIFSGVARQALKRSTSFAWSRFLPMNTWSRLRLRLWVGASVRVRFKVGVKA